MFFTNEYTEEILDELTKIFNTKYDKASLERAVNESDILSPNNVFRMNINDNRIVIDCNNKDWIYSLIVITNESFSKEVSKTMLKWDNYIRKEYEQELIIEESDVFGESDTLLNKIERYYSFAQ